MKTLVYKNNLYREATPGSKTSWVILLSGGINVIVPAASEAAARNEFVAAVKGRFAAIKRMGPGGYSVFRMPTQLAASVNHFITSHIDEKMQSEAEGGEADRIQRQVEEEEGKKK